MNFKVSIIIIVFLMFIISLSGFAFGWSSAFGKKDFMIIEQDNPVIIIGEYKDGFLVAPFDEDSIIPKYSYYKPNNDTVMYVKELGKLKIDEVK